MIEQTVDEILDAYEQTHMNQRYLALTESNVSLGLVAELCGDMPDPDHEMDSLELTICEHIIDRIIDRNPHLRDEREQLMELAGWMVISLNFAYPGYISEVMTTQHKHPRLTEDGTEAEPTSDTQRKFGQFFIRADEDDDDDEDAAHVGF